MKHTTTYLKPGVTERLAEAVALLNTVGLTVAEVADMALAVDIANATDEWLIEEPDDPRVSFDDYCDGEMESAQEAWVDELEQTRKYFIEETVL